MKLPDSLNNAISYSWVLGWYAGRDGATTDNGKMQATKDIKKKHPDVVKACSCHDGLLAACKQALIICEHVGGMVDTCTRLEQAITKAENKELLEKEFNYEGKGDIK